MGVSLAIGAVLGFAASSVVGPSVIGWWYAPPIKDAFSCAGSVHAALAQFVSMQLISAAVGGVAAAIIVHLVRSSRTPSAPSNELRGGRPSDSVR